MSQHRQIQKKRKPSLFSKFKLWCAYKHIPYIVITLIVSVLLALLMFIIGGSLAGWNVWGMLGSPMAFLIYAIILVLLVVAIFKHFSDSNAR